MWAEWIKGHWRMLVPLVLGAIAIMWLMPRPGRGRSIPAALLALASLGAAGFFLIQPGPDLVENVLFSLMSGVAVIAAVCMITNRDPVYAALWFAVVTLSVCGLFLLQSAPFLSAATVVVYAGAIIVTFVFVIMLARQSGGAAFDRSSDQPVWATLAAFLLLGGILTALGDWRAQPAGDGQKVAGGPMLSPPATWQGKPLETNVLSQPAEGASPNTMRGLGRSLFGDYLFAVELAGTLLMVASVGAVAIAPRRAQGGL